MKVELLLCVLILLILFYFNNSSYKIEGFSNNKNKNKKIAFCFLIYDKINNEDLWHQLFQSIDTNKYNIYIHYKENKPLNYFEKYKLKNTIDTCWGCLSVVEAQHLILKEALKDSENTHFIWLSQSCLPLKSFDYIYTNLNENKSYFNIAPDTQVRINIKQKLKFIENNNIKKAAMPSILNRNHAIKLVQNEDKLSWFKDIKNVDEIAIITLLYHIGLKNELELTPNLSADAKIFTAWPDMKNYKKFNKSKLSKNSPNEYKEICSEELDYLIKSESLFGRKFLDKCGGLENLIKQINNQ